jgi:cell division protein FtsQ
MAQRSKPARRKNTGPSRSQRLARVALAGAGHAGWWLRANIVHAPKLWPAALLVGLLTLVAWQLNHGETFRLTEVRIAPCQHVTDAELRRHVNAHPGQNIFAIDLGEEAKNVRKHDWVRGAVVKRILPSSLEIEVIERRPVALWETTAIYLVDDQGVPFKILAEGDPRDLPILTGFSVAAFNKGQAAAEQQAAHLEKAVALIDAAQDMGVLRETDISEVRFDPVIGFSIIVVGNGLTVRFGHDDFERKLENFHQVAKRLDSRLAGARYVDLDVPGRVVVRGLPEGSGV